MSIKLRAKAAKKMEGFVQVKALMSHPMETGLRKDKAGEKIPSHFIKEVIIQKNGANVVTVDWNSSVSKNPYLATFVKAGSGDKITMTWTDTKGATETAETTVK